MPQRGGMKARSQMLPRTPELRRSHNSALPALCFLRWIWTKKRKGEQVHGLTPCSALTTESEAVVPTDGYRVAVPPKEAPRRLDALTHLANIC